MNIFLHLPVWLYETHGEESRLLRWPQEEQLSQREPCFHENNVAKKTVGQVFKDAGDSTERS